MTRKVLNVFILIFMLLGSCNKETDFLDAPTKSNAYDSVNSFDCIDGECETVTKGPYSTMEECALYCGENYSAITDPRDGNVYRTVVINGKRWFKENLRYTDGVPFFDDPQGFFEAQSPGWISYDLDMENFERYGAMYNAYAVIEFDLCPDGWHVATNQEFVNAVSLFDQPVGNAFVSTAGWKVPRSKDANGNRNLSGFTALPGGCFAYTPFEDIGERAYFWTSTISSDENFH